MHYFCTFLVGLRDSLLVFHPHGFLGKSFAGEASYFLIHNITKVALVGNSEQDSYSMN